MSTLVLVLTAAMAVPGNGREMVSGEVEQGLDLRGTWEGTWTEGTKTDEATLDENGELRRYFPNRNRCVHIGFFQVDDVGDRKLRIKRARDYLGIYRREGENVVICFRKADQGYPTDFRAGDGQTIFILHRVKRNK